MEPLDGSEHHAETSPPDSGTGAETHGSHVIRASGGMQEGWPGDRGTGDRDCHLVRRERGNRCGEAESQGGPQGRPGLEKRGLWHRTRT